jgi:hypothetical protein
VLGAIKGGKFFDNLSNYQFLTAENTEWSNMHECLTLQVTAPGDTTWIACVERRCQAAAQDCFLFEGF